MTKVIIAAKLLIRYVQLYSLSLLYKARFKIQSRLYGISDKWVVAFYADLIELDWEEFVTVGPFQIFAFGQTAIIKHQTSAWSINQKHGGGVYIHESEKEGPWQEVYRSNVYVKDTRFWDIFRILDYTLAEHANDVCKGHATIQINQSHSVPGHLGEA